MTRYKGRQYVMTIEVSPSESEDGWEAIARNPQSAIGVCHRDENEAIKGAKANGLIALAHSMRSVRNVDNNYASILFVVVAPIKRSNP